MNDGRVILDTWIRKGRQVRDVDMSIGVSLRHNVGREARAIEKVRDDKKRLCFYEAYLASRHLDACFS